MSFHVYVLRCADGTYYTGHTEDLDVRMGQHQAGSLGGYTAKRLPVTLMWSEWFPTREQALTVEAQVKSWSKAKKEALFRSDWASVSHYSRPPARRGLPPRPRFSTSLEPGSGQTGVLGEPSPPIRLSRAEVELAETSSRGTAPIIVLVRPQLAENIGKTARAMLNFGLTELRLVEPRDGWPNPDAGPAASGADVVLANATVHATLAEAVADCTHVYATTVRRRELVKPVVTPEQAAAAIVSEPGRSALVFGPERSGLETADVALARSILTIPINPDFGSLNLAQAVIVIAYEWSKHQALALPPVVDLGEPAPQAALEGLIGAFETMLEDKGYFHPPERTEATKRSLRTLLTKPRWTVKEVQMLRGILTQLTREAP